MNKKINMNINSSLIYPQELANELLFADSYPQHDIEQFVAETSAIYQAYVELVWENKQLLQMIEDMKSQYGEL